MPKLSESLRELAEGARIKESCCCIDTIQSCQWETLAGQVAVLERALDLATRNVAADLVAGTEDLCDDCDRGDCAKCELTVEPGAEFEKIYLAEAQKEAAKCQPSA